MIMESPKNHGENFHLFEKMSPKIKEAINFVEISEIDESKKEGITCVLNKTLDRMKQTNDSFRTNHGDVVHYTLHQVANFVNKNSGEAERDLFGVIHDLLWEAYQSV